MQPLVILKYLSKHFTTVYWHTEQKIICPSIIFPKAKILIFHKKINDIDGHWSLNGYSKSAPQSYYPEDPLLVATFKTLAAQHSKATAGLRPKDDRWTSFH